jgi:hypothetical protein
MLNEGEACERKRQLLQDLLQAASQVSRMAGAQAEKAGQKANERAEVDGMLQRAASQQQHALLALERHQQEHGC